MITKAPMMFRRMLRTWMLAPLAMAVLLAAPAPAVAQVPAPPDEAAILFDDAIVHEFRFVINTKDWETLKVNYLDNTYYPVDFQWNGIIVRNAGIRSRGTGSRSGAKPGLRLDFDRYTSDQRFLGLKSLVLRNSTQDPSNMHERVSMLVFRRLGLAAPREVYARLYVNNVYSGLYAIVESVDKAFLAKTYGNDAGYLYKYDYNVTDAPYYLEYRTSNPADYVPHPFKPETHEADPRGDVIERFVSTVNNTPEASFRTAIAEFLDVTGFIRHVAGEVFVADNDGFLGNWGMNNFYMYRFAENNQLKFISWDKSESFKDTPDYWIWHNILDAPPPVQNRLWVRLMAYPDLKAQFLDTLLECVRIADEIPVGSDPLDTRGWLVREIDRQYQQIAPSVMEDVNKPYTNDQFVAAAQFMRDFALQRSAFVTSQVAASR